MEPRVSPDGEERKKESFSQFVTRIAGISGGISLACYFFVDSLPIQQLAWKVFTLAAWTWGLFAALPFIALWLWARRAGAVAWLKSRLKPVAMAKPDRSVSAQIWTSERSEPDTRSAQSGAIPTMGEVFLPAPFSLLPPNPMPNPSSTLQRENAGQIIADAIQLAGLPVEGETVEVLDIESGPTLQTISFLLPPKLQVSKLANKKDDIANHLGHHQGFDVSSPTRFRSAAAFTLPHEHRAYVYMRDIAAEFLTFAKSAALPVIFGKDVRGNPIMLDLTKMPHLLLAGATGSGKSVFINGLLSSLLSVRSSQELRLLLIDPKQVELAVYGGFPHLLAPPVTDMRKAVLALAKVVEEMDRRYEQLASAGVRNIGQYNQKASEPLPYIVVVIDEYADLMMVAGGAVEDAVTRIAQKARAAGIHLILGTQRPSVNVVTGIIKANLPSRVAFRLESAHDYRTVLDGGSPHLLGFGDGICRIQGGFMQRFQSASISVDDAESTAYIDGLKDYWNTKGGSRSEEWSMETDDPPQDENPPWETEPEWPEEKKPSSLKDLSSFAPARQPQKPAGEYEQALKLAHEHGGISVSMLQRNLRIGYSAAAKLVMRMAEEGLIGELDPERNMRMLIVDKEVQAAEEKTELIERIKLYICRTRSAKSSQIKETFGIRKEYALKLMQELADEGFLHVPTSTKIGYTLAWSEEEIENYVALHDAEDEDFS